MPTLLFPDTTVLCNFASVERIDLLSSWLDGRGRWCEAIHAEVRRSVAYWSDLSRLLGAQSPLGDPITIDDEQLIGRINGVRRFVFGGSDSEPLKHLGEAQTCVLIQEEPRFQGSWWITEDADAFEYASRQHITALRTRDVMAHMISIGEISAESAFDLMTEMDRKGRSLSMPNSAKELQQ